MATKDTFISFFDKADDDQSCISKMKFYNYKLNWTIENFDITCKNVKLIQSSKFPAKDLENTQWYLELKPTELNNTNIEQFYIYLKNTNNVVRLINVEITFSFHDASKRFITNKLCCRKELLWIASGSELYSDFKNTVPKTILVTCELSVFKSTSSVINKPLFNFPKSNDLVENIKNLLDCEDSKDVTFKVMDEEFSAHKIILAARSLVFAAMFKNKMSEGLSSVVEIKDTKPSIFQQMLYFIYSDSVENLEESALELCYLAEKYQLEKLKTMCMESLYNNLSSKTVVDVLEIADLVPNLDLRNKCLKLLNTEFETYETKEFQQLIQNRPYLLTEILKIRKTISREDDEYSQTLKLEFHEK